MTPDRHRTAQLVERVLDRPGRAAVSCSFQEGGVALVHMLRRYQPDIPVLFVDTGYHFPETLRFRDELADAWGLDLRTLRSDLSVPDQEQRLGVLNRTDPDRCCSIRKVDPLYRALEGFDLWFTGIQRDQSPTRAGTRPVERKLLPTGHVVEKVNPLVAWSRDDIVDYHRRHALPRHPLHERGYRSIGCAPCSAPSPSGDVRAGRWSGFAKTECGLHTQAQDIA